MNKIYDNWEKIVCLAMVGILIISSFIFIGNNADYTMLIEQMEDKLRDTEIADAVKLDFPGALSAKIDNKAKIDLMQIKRNIFVPFKDDEKKQDISSPVLELVDISYKPLPVQYQGRIVYPNGQIVAQINANNKSYLVKIGSSVGKYKVEQLDKDSVILKTKQGEFVNIKYLQTAFSDELMAKIKDRISGNIETVYKNSNIYGYQVLDIEGDCVLLSKSGQHLRLQKGSVQVK